MTALPRAHWPRPTEAQITATIRAYLTLRGYWTFKVHGHLGQMVGVPDLLACKDGRLVAVEVKRPGGRLSREQERQIAELRAAGALVVVAMGVDDLVAEGI